MLLRQLLNNLIQSRRLDLTTTTFLWQEQRCKILCIFCYFRFALGQSKVAKYTKNLAMLLWPEERCCCQVQPSRLKLGDVRRGLSCCQSGINYPPFLLFFLSCRIFLKLIRVVKLNCYVKLPLATVASVAIIHICAMLYFHPLLLHVTT